MKKLNSDVTSQGVYYGVKGRPSVNSRGGDGVVIIFGINRLSVFRRGI
jgi:hypothetical protein